jgi:hypothetical protein
MTRMTNYNDVRIVEGHKLLGVVWFTLFDGECIGIVLMNNGFEDKAYIGRGKGLYEPDDIEFILAWGSTFPVESARLLVGGM